VSYEKLHADTAAEATRITDFLGLRWTPEQLAEAVERNAASNAQKTGGTPIVVKGEFGGKEGATVREPEGFVRRARPGGGREELSWLSRQRIKWAARREMAMFGYS
jgi:hypothetical protein